MLAGLRNATRNWIVRIGLVVVAITMAVTLVQGDALQMLGSMFAPQGVASVSGKTITQRDLARQMENFLRTQSQNGRQITQAEAVEAGLHQQLLQQMIERTAVQEYARDLGVEASIRQTADSIRSQPFAQNPLTGSFDRQAYADFLNQIGYTQPQFEAEIRGDIGVNMLMNALLAGVRSPSSYGNLLVAYETERRTVSIAQGEVSIVGAIPPPNEAQLQAFYEDSAAQLRVPEYRALTIVFARASDFVSRVTIPEAQLREEFEARRASLTQAERRSFVQLSAQTEEQARDAAQRLARGESPEAVAQALQLQVVRYDQEEQSRVADSAVGQAVFALNAGAAPTAVRGRLSPWAAVQLQSVTPAVAPTFESERERIHDEIAAEEAAELLDAAVGAFEEARSGGTAIAEAARASGLAVVSVPAIDAQGLAPDGQPPEALIDQPDIVEMAFETPEGDATDFLPIGDADVVVSVDRVTPPTTRPLDDVREQLTAAWIARERARRLREAGEAMVAAIEGGQDFAAAARANRMQVVVSSQPLGRRDAGQLPARGLGNEIFTHDAGDVVIDMRVDGGAVLVAQVESIERTDPATVPELVEQARLQMQQSLGQSLEEAIVATAVAKGRPRRNEQQIQQLYPATAPEGEESQ